MPQAQAEPPRSFLRSEAVYTPGTTRKCRLTVTALVQPERNLQRENVQWRPCERIHANRALPRADPVSEAGCTRMERLVKLSYAIRLREYQLSALGPRAVASRHLRPHCDRRGRVRGVSSTTIIRSDSVLYEPRRFGTVAVLHVAWRFDFTRPSNIYARWTRWEHSEVWPQMWR